MSYCVPCSAVCAEKRIKPGGVYFMAQCLRAEKWIWGLICRFKPRRKQQGSLVRFLLRPSGEVNELRQESGLTSRPPPVREVASSEPAVDGNIWTSCTCIAEMLCAGKRAASSWSLSHRSHLTAHLKEFYPRTSRSRLLLSLLPPLFIFSPKCLRCSSLCELSS